MYSLCLTEHTRGFLFKLLEESYGYLIIYVNVSELVLLRHIMYHGYELEINKQNKKIHRNISDKNHGYNSS